MNKKPWIDSTDYGKNTKNLKYQTHPFKPAYEYINPEPTAVDQFAPLLSKKISKSRSSVTRRPLSAMQNKGRESKIIRVGKQPKYQGNPDACVFTGGPTNNLSDHIHCESTFDSIAAGSLDTPLSHLVESNFVEFFQAERVHFFHDIASINTLFTPNLGVSVPYGSGIVGYCHFSKKIMRLPSAESHVSYNIQYDGRLCDPTSSILCFPVFNNQNQICAIVEIVRNSVMPMFTDLDEQSVEYFQEKFKLFSRWLFQEPISENTYAEFAKVDRTGTFIDRMCVKLTKYFSCKTAELWEYHTNTKELFQLIPNFRDPQFVQISDAGIVSYALSKCTTISIEKCEMHASFNPKTDIADQSLLVLPVLDPDHPIVYGIALRGKRLPSFFTDTDERLLCKLSQVIMNALASSRDLEESYKMVEESAVAQNRLKSLLDVAQIISGQLQIDELIPSIMNRACDLVRADRCSLFMVNDTGEKLVTSFQGGLSNAIEIPINAGIVGCCATSGEILNIKDAYEDQRFSRKTDLETGYRTLTLLCVPIFDEKGSIKGVTEMINKLDGVFTREDEQMMQVFNVFVGISVQNAKLYKASIELTMQLRSILEISQNIAHSSRMRSVLESILSDSRKVVGAGRGLMYMVDQATKEIEVYAVSEDADAKELRTLMKQESNGVNARRAMIKMMLTGKADTSDSDKNKTDDEARVSYVREAIQKRSTILHNVNENPTASLIVAPVNDDRKHTVIGAILMQWKRSAMEFSSQDAKMCEAFAIFVSLALEKARMRDIKSLGAREMSIRETFSENDRPLLKTPSEYLIPAPLDRSMFTADMTEIDRNKAIFAIFGRFGLRERFQISNESLHFCLFDLKDMYRPEDFALAFDAFQFAAVMLDMQELEPESELTLLFACLCSGLAHGLIEVAPSDLLFGSDNNTGKHRAAIAMALMTKAGVFNQASNAWPLFVSLISDDNGGGDVGLMYRAAVVSQPARRQSVGEQWMKLFSNNGHNFVKYAAEKSLPAFTALDEQMPIYGRLTAQIKLNLSEWGYQCL